MDRLFKVEIRKKRKNMDRLFKVDIESELNTMAVLDEKY